MARLRAVIVRRSLAVAALLAAVPLLSSCGVNFGAQTDQVYNPAVGVNDRSGSVYVLNALIVSGTDGSGTVVATLVNEDQHRSDTLKAVGAGDPNAQDITGKMTPPTTIPAGGYLSLDDKGNVTVKGPTIKPGAFIPLTFTFDHGKAVVVDVPVEPWSDPDYANVPLAPAS
jgi:copper(I)-binding protein